VPSEGLSRIFSFRHNDAVKLLDGDAIGREVGF
jgi:hypothetical protein